MLVGLISFGVAFFAGAVWLLPHKIMLATANRRFRHLSFHAFIEAAPFPYSAMRRLLIAGAGAGSPILALGLFEQEDAALAAAIMVFGCFVTLFVSDFMWVESAAGRLQREGRDVPS